MKQINKYNFILPVNTDRCVPTNTVGLFYKALLEQCAAGPSEVAFNGNKMKLPVVMCPKNQVSFVPRRVRIPDLLLSILRDLRLSRPFNIPASYFKPDFINIVLIGHHVVLPQLSDKYRLVGLLDEPPSLSDNFKFTITYRFVQHRFRQQLVKYDKFWVYHEAGAEFLRSIGVESPLYTYPCVLNYSPVPSTTRLQNPVAPFKIVMASSYLPWHQTSEMLISLKPHLENGDLCITLIGNGPTRTETEMIAKDIPRVTFVDGLNYDEYLTYLQKFDFGILWKIPWFNSPLKLMDYSRAQIGIITYETFAIRSIFPEDTYYTIDEFKHRISTGTGFRDYQPRVARMTEFMNEKLNVKQLQNHLNRLQS